MTNVKPQVVFSESLETVLEAVKSLQASKKPRTEILIELNKLIHDTTLFSQKQRANVVREVNKEFGLKVSMSEIKRAIRTVNTAKPEKATPVDALSGNATLKVSESDKPNAADAQSAKPAAAAAAKPTGGKRTAAATETNTSENSNQESATMPPIKETLQAVSNRLAVGAPQTHEEKIAALTETLNAAGATTEEGRHELIKAFIAANPSLEMTWNLMRAYPQPEHGVVGTLVAYLEIDPENRSKFEAYLKPVAAVADTALPELGTEAATAAINAATAANPPAPGNTAAPAPAKPDVAVAVEVVAPGLTERVMTTIRGDRKTGFSSGVVAAATAVVGGGLEMAFKGSMTLGTGVGAAVGATGAYFLADATENLMESETGRYLLAGAIGVVAGGLGSRLGRGVEQEYKNPSADITGTLETVLGTQPPAAQSEGLVGNSDALLSMFGM